MFLVKLARTHAKQMHAFPTASCPSSEMGSLWQWSAGLHVRGVISQPLRLGVLSATLDLAVSLAIQFSGVLNLYFVQAARTGVLINLFPNGSLFLLPHQYCCAWCLCLFLPLLSLPTTYPAWALLGSLIVDASGVSKQFVCSSTLHCDKSMPPNWLLGGSAASHMQLVCSQETPLVHSGPNPPELDMNFLVHGATQGHLLLRHVPL